MHQIHLRIKFREKPTAAEGKGSLGERGGERGREWDAHRGFRGATPSIWVSRVLGEAAAAQ